MKFSIIIPVYNVEKYLKKCLTSIVQQNFNDYELILVDDGSTDMSGKICDEFEEKYNNICINRDRGKVRMGIRKFYQYLIVKRNGLLFAVPMQFA
mgnify:CR=1 FL=1